jgi:hypothetical protein
LQRLEHAAVRVIEIDKVSLTQGCQHVVPRHAGGWA